MKHLNKEWGKVTEDIKGAYLYLFLDFDGTLAPIRKDPQKVRLSRRIYDALRKLSGANDVSIAVISGRELDEVRKIIGLKNIVYVGNHGFEAAGPGMDFKLPSAERSRKTIGILGKKLKKDLRRFRGVTVEDKKLTLSVHFRMADKKSVEGIARTFDLVTRPYRRQGKIRITAGKKVREVRPSAAWDKGRMVEKLLKRKKRELKKKVTTFCMGDDRTDEDVFRRLKNRGYTVKITERPDEKSMADYYLRNIREVDMFLEKLYSLRRRTRRHV